MLETFLEHWIIILAVSVTLVIVWIAALLSKYVRLMLNIIRDTPPPLLMGPFDFERVEGQAVTFRAFDGTTLRGMFLSHDLLPQTMKRHPHQKPVEPSHSNEDSENGAYLNTKTRGVIIFCHEYGSDLYSYMRYCRPLLHAGYDIFTFDFRSHGRSSSSPGYEPRLWPSDKEVSDCLGAIAMVQAELEDRNLDINIGLFGISRGAGAAIMAAHQAGGRRAVKAVVSDSAFSTDTTLEWSMKRWVHIFARVRFVYENHPPVFWRFIRWLLLRFARVRFKCRFPSVRKTVSKLADVPVFFIHGFRDSYIKPDQARMLYEASQQPRYLWIVPEAKHNQSVMVDGDRYAARTVAFFDKYLTKTPRVSDRPDATEQEAIVFFRSRENLSCPEPQLPDTINEDTIRAKTSSPSGGTRRVMERPEAMETIRKTASPLPSDSE